MFLLAFFTLIIKPSTTVWSEIGYGIEIMLIHLIWFSWLSLMVTHRYVKARLDKIQHYIVKIMGVVFIAFGARIAALHMK